MDTKIWDTKLDTTSDTNSDTKMDITMDTINGHNFGYKLFPCLGGASPPGPNSEEGKYRSHAPYFTWAVCYQRCYQTNSFPGQTHIWTPPGSGPSQIGHCNFRNSRTGLNKDEASACTWPTDWVRCITHSASPQKHIIGDAIWYNYVENYGFNAVVWHRSKS